MDLDAVWQQVLRFQENYIATSGSIAPSPQEQALVRDFLLHVPVAALFECLQDASNRYDDKQVREDVYRLLYGCMCNATWTLSVASYACVFGLVGERDLLLHRSSSWGGW